MTGRQLAGSVAAVAAFGPRRNLVRACAVFSAAVLAALAAGAAPAAHAGVGEGRAADERTVNLQGEFQPERPPTEFKIAARGWTVALGGQILLRGDVARNQSLTDFTFAPRHDESQFLQRSRPHVSVADPALGVSLFVQGQWYGRWGSADRRSDPDLYQGYVECHQLFGWPLDLKLGRQDFVYGSAFFLGANDFYNGLSWDAVKASLRPRDHLLIDVLAGRMARLNPEDPDIYLGGVHATYTVNDAATLAGYLFVNKGGFPFFHREFEIRDAGQRWFTAGARLAGTVGGFDYELEPLFQWGRVRTVLGDGSNAVRAYGGHLDLGYTLPLSWKPRLFASYAFGSGHNDIFDGTYGEFHGNLFKDDSLAGDMSVLADLSGITVGDAHASGMHIGVVGLSMSPRERLNIDIDVHRFVADTVPSSDFSTDLGVEINLVASYALTDAVTILAGVNRFFTGRFFGQAAGSSANINYVYLQTQVEF